MPKELLIPLESYTRSNPCDHTRLSESYKEAISLFNDRVFLSHGNLVLVELNKGVSLNDYASVSKSIFRFTLKRSQHTAFHITSNQGFYSLLSGQEIENSSSSTEIYRVYATYEKCYLILPKIFSREKSENLKVGDMVTSPVMNITESLRCNRVRPFINSSKNQSRFSVIYYAQEYRIKKLCKKTNVATIETPAGTFIFHKSLLCKKLDLLPYLF